MDRGKRDCRTAGASRNVDLTVDEADAQTAAAVLPGGEVPCGEAKMPRAEKLVFACVAAATYLRDVFDF